MTTARDYLRFAQMLLGDGRFGDIRRSGPLVSDRRSGISGQPQNAADDAVRGDGNHP